MIESIVPAGSSYAWEIDAIFTFMFATFPAGLVLYWLTNNVITAIQNLIINRTLQRKAG